MLLLMLAASAEGACPPGTAEALGLTLNLPTIDARTVQQGDIASYRQAIAAARQEIDRLRAWVATRRDPCERDAYDMWFKRYEWGYTEAEMHLRQRARQGSPSVSPPPTR